MHEVYRHWQYFTMELLEGMYFIHFYWQIERKKMCLIVSNGKELVYFSAIINLCAIIGSNESYKKSVEHWSICNTQSCVQLPSTKWEKAKILELTFLHVASTLWCDRKMMRITEWKVHFVIHGSLAASLHPPLTSLKKVEILY